MADRSALSKFVADMTAPQPAPAPVPAVPSAPVQSGTDAAVRGGAEITPPAVAAPAQGPSREQRMSAIRNIATENPLAGNTAYKLYSGEQERQNRVADKVYEMLKSNAPDQISYARVMAQQHGIIIPDEIFVNAQSRGRFVGMIETGKSMGYTPQQFAAFLAETTKNGSMGQDIQAGAAAAGKLPGGRYTGHRSGGAGGSVFQQKQAAWLKVHPNDRQGALDYASGRRQMTYADTVKLADQMVAREASSSMRPMSPAQRTQKREEYIKMIRQQGHAEPAQASPGAPPTAPVSNYPMPQDQQEFDALPSGTIYTDPDDGQLYKKP